MYLILNLLEPRLNKFFTFSNTLNYCGLLILHRNSDLIQHFFDCVGHEVLWFWLDDKKKLCTKFQVEVV